MTPRRRFRTVARMSNHLRNEYLEELAAIPLLSGLWRRDLEKVARAADVVDVDAGTVMLEQGTYGHHLFVVATGSATLVEGGRPSAMLGPGDTFGEAAVFTGAPHSVSVIAASPARLLILGRSELFPLLRAGPALAEKLLRVLARHAGQERPVAGAATVGIVKVDDDPGAAPEPRRPLRA
jgi:trk system potassium uptake protein TrkA